MSLHRPACCANDHKFVLIWKTELSRCPKSPTILHKGSWEHHRAIHSYSKKKQQKHKQQQQQQQNQPNNGQCHYIHLQVTHTTTNLCWLDRKNCQDLKRGANIHYLTKIEFDSWHGFDLIVMDTAAQSSINSTIHSSCVWPEGKG